MLVFSAGRFNRRRVVTDEGYEQTFTLYVLSRYLLADRLRPALERSENSVILNLCGVGGLRGGRIHWDDPHLESGYSMMTAVLQGARANDLLGAGFHDQYPDSPVRYVLYNPLFVDSGLHRHLDQPGRAVLGTLAAVFGTRPRAIADRLVALLADHPAKPLTARRRDRPIPVTGPAFDRDEAARLYTLVGKLTAGDGAGG